MIKRMLLCFILFILVNAVQKRRQSNTLNCENFILKIVASYVVRVPYLQWVTQVLVYYFSSKKEVALLRYTSFENFLILLLINY